MTEQIQALAGELIAEGSYGFHSKALTNHADCTAAEANMALAEFVARGVLESVAEVICPFCGRTVLAGEPGVAPPIGQTLAHEDCHETFDGPAEFVVDERVVWVTYRPPAPVG